MERKKGSINAIVEIQGDGFSAFLDIPNHAITSSGESLFELKENIQEAVDLFVETAKDLNIDVSKIEGKKVELRLDVKQLFGYYKTLNITGFALYSGINRSLLNQYAKGLKIPSEKQSLRILKGIHKLGKDLTSIYSL